MIVRLYMDEDSMDQALISAFRARGIDVLTAFDAGMVRQSDEAHLAFATAQGGVLCTFNVGDFCRRVSRIDARTSGFPKRLDT